MIVWIAGHENWQIYVVVTYLVFVTILYALGLLFLIRKALRLLKRSGIRGCSLSRVKATLSATLRRVMIIQDKLLSLKHV